VLKFAVLPSPYTRFALNPVIQQSRHGRETANDSLLCTIPGMSMLPPGIVDGP